MYNAYFRGTIYNRFFLLNEVGRMSCEYVQELRKFVAPEIILGTDARLLVGRYIEHFESQKPMIVTDADVDKTDWFRDIVSEVSAHAANHIIFDEVSSNPKDIECMNGAKRFLDEACDLIIAVGGGSPMDCAKGISIVSTNGGNILDYEGVDRIDQPGPPLICIPSTAGTAADVSQFAIILDTEANLKKAIISKKVVPDLALIDPVPLLTMDPYLLACTGMDALTHAIEAYVSNAQSALTDVHALEAIRLLSTGIQKAMDGEKTVGNYYEMMLGSLQAGLAFSNASLGAVHAMAHSLGGVLNLPHGECNSILLGPVIEINFHSAPKRYGCIAVTMGIDTDRLNAEEIRLLLVKKIRDLREHLGIAEFVAADKTAELLDKLADAALNDPCMVTNPKKLEKQEVKGLYERIIRAER